MKMATPQLSVCVSISWDNSVAITADPIHTPTLIAWLTIYMVQFLTNVNITFTITNWIDFVNQYIWEKHTKTLHKPRSRY